MIIEYKDDDDLRQKLRKKKFNRFCGDHVWTYLILATIVYGLGCIAFYIQAKLNGWCP